MSPFTVAMLAGGRSMRMGTDKATFAVGGQELGQRVLVAAVLSGASEVLAVGGQAASLAGQGWGTVADTWPGEGPLGAIISALRAASHDIVVVVACDLPDLDAEALTHLVSCLEGQADADVVVPVREGRREVLHSAWRRRCVAALERRFAAGERSPSVAIGDLRVQETTVPEASLADLDTPADVAIYLDRPETGTGR